MMNDKSWPRKWFEGNFKIACEVPSEVFRRSLFLMLIESFAQMAADYESANGNKKCFREFVLKYSDLRDNLQMVCPITLYYDYKDKYHLPEPDVFKGWIYGYTDEHLRKESDLLLSYIPEGNQRDSARNRHRYVNLLYQMRSKLVHELSISGSGVDFSDEIPQVSSGHFSDVDDAGNIVTIPEASLNFPEKFIARLTWETVENYLDECERDGRSPIPLGYHKRKCRLGWYD